MNDYRLRLLYSGSTGNAALLESGDDAFLIDAGKSARTLSAALAEAGCPPERLSAVFLTHEHRDHTTALAVFLKRHPMPVHATERCAAALLSHADRDAIAPYLVVHPPLFSVQVGPFCVSSFETPHDSPGSVGYRVRICREAVHEIGYVTDVGCVTESVLTGLCGCEAAVIECNHDEAMLMTGPYPEDLKRRIASARGHLSNADCAAFAVKLAASGVRRLLLAHLSETNNTPELALAEVTAALKGTDVTVRAAAPDRITEL